MRWLILLTNLSFFRFAVVRGSTGVDGTSLSYDTGSPPSAPPPLSFVTIGDSGNPGPDLSATAGAIFDVHKASPLSFLVLTGDLCYEDDFVSKSYARFHELISRPFADINVQIYATMGDNDYDRVESAGTLLAYTRLNEIDPRWYMPNLYYHLIHEANGVSMCTLHIDTQSLVEVSSPGARTVEVQKTLDDQLGWIKRTLGSEACQDTTFIVVFGHHPLFSVSRKGNKGNTSENLRNKLIPLLDEFFVDAYFSGHEHDLQALTRTEADKHSISFIVSGSSSKLRKKLYDRKVDGINSWHERKVIGFTITEVKEDSMITRFIASATGGTLHTHVTKSHRHLRCPAGVSSLRPVS